MKVILWRSLNTANKNSFMTFSVWKQIVSEHIVITVDGRDNRKW